MFKKCCKVCKKEKPLEDFSKHRTTKDRRNIVCRECDNKRRHQKYINDGNIGRHKHRLRRHNVSPQEYDILFNKQNGLCAICKKPETKKFNDKIITLSIDHNHTTNKVRGLLCHKCNTAVGLFSDDKDLLQRAIQYLDSYV